MTKVVSFVVFGQDAIYNEGLIENIRLAEIFYPGWEIWVYATDVSDAFIRVLRESSVFLIVRNCTPVDKYLPLLWRFEPIEDPLVDIMIVRDTDSRIGSRESQSVAQWLNTNSALHIIRDHPFHSSLIQAGMFGIRKTSSYTLPNYKHYLGSLPTHSSRVDEIFLEKYVYPLGVSHAYINAQYNNYEKSIFTLGEPTDITGYIGQKFFRHNRKDQEDRQARQVMSKFHRSPLYRFFLYLRYLHKRIKSNVYEKNGKLFL